MSKKSFIVRIPFLENQHLVNCALPGLAKKNGLKKEEGWQILEANLEIISKKISLLGSSDQQIQSQVVNLNMQVQKWYQRNLNNLSVLGLNIFKKRRPKANDITYPQLVCIMLLDGLFSRKAYIQGGIIRDYKKVKKAPWRQRLSWWWSDFKNKYF